MAGAFTHLVVSFYATREKKVLGKELMKLLNKHYRFVYLGSVSPDLPYLSFKTGSVNWADVMHYEKTNSIVSIGHDRLKAIWPNRTDADEVKLAWLFGYASHMVTDATIHPIVKAIVGNYADNPSEHRLCEMTQDSLIFNEKMNDDLRYDEFSEMVKFCDESGHFDALMDFWTELLVSNYGSKQDTPHPSFWFKTYGEAIDTAEGGSGLIPIFRHIGLDALGIIYRTQADIEESHPKELIKYYQKVKLPTQAIGNFARDGFGRALTNVADAWKRLYEGLNGPLIVSDVIRNWDLDTGIDQDSTNGDVTYWGQ
jgi:hypothetical protein